MSSVVNLGKKSFSLAFFGLGKCRKIRKMAKEKNVVTKFSYIFLNKNNFKEKDFFPYIFLIFQNIGRRGPGPGRGGSGGENRINTPLRE